MGIGDSRFLLQDIVLMMAVPEDSRLDVYELYNQEPLTFGDVTNQKLMVYGATIYEFDLTKKTDGTIVPRYFQNRILVDLDGQLRVIKSSGRDLLRHIAYLCKREGWYMFKEPIEYKFVHKGPGKPHIMEAVNKKYIVPKSQRESANAG
jgi:hypothetical protein